MSSMKNPFHSWPSSKIAIISSSCAPATAASRFMKFSSPNCRGCGLTNVPSARSVSTCCRTRSKFTPQAGEIWLKVGWTASGGQYVSVKDTGPAFRKRKFPIVLASFGQGSNSIKSAEQGAGLGLPIAKSLVDLHGGTFTLKSKLRIGTEVIVTFPPERVVAAMAPMPEHAPPIASATEPDLSPEEKRRLSRRPLFRAGT